MEIKTGIPSIKFPLNLLSASVVPIKCQLTGFYMRETLALNELT